MDAIMEFLKTQGIEFTTSQIGESLGAMAQGMLGIFIVIALIVAVTVLLNTLTAKKDKDTDAE